MRPEPAPVGPDRPSGGGRDALPRGVRAWLGSCRLAAGSPPALAASVPTMRSVGGRLVNPQKRSGSRGDSGGGPPDPRPAVAVGGGVQSARSSEGASGARTLPVVSFMVLFA